jgi:outer membrane protein assembly factor BamB
MRPVLAAVLAVALLVGCSRQAPEEAEVSPGSATAGSPAEVASPHGAAPTAPTGPATTGPTIDPDAPALPAPPPDTDPEAAPEAGGTTGWRLDALDAGRRILQITVWAHGCNPFERLHVDEAATAVTLTARTTPETEGCGDALLLRPVVVVLDEPLGDRELRGCDPPAGSDCLRLDRDTPAGVEPILAGAHVVADDAGVAVDDGRRLGHIGADGAPNWRHVWDEPEHGAIWLAGDLVLKAGLGRRLLAFQRDGGAQRWEATVHGGERDSRAVGEGVVAGALSGGGSPADPAYRRPVGALRLGDGALLWQHDLGGRFASAHRVGDVLLVASVEPQDAPAGTPAGAVARTVLEAFGLPGGERRWERRLAGGLDGIATAGGTAVVSTWGARYGIEVASGAERWRTLPVENAPMLGTGEAVLLLGADRRWTSRLDLATGAATALAEPLPAETFLAGDLLISVDAAGTATARERGSGAVRWTAPLHAQVSPPVRHRDKVVFGTPIGALALDALDGRVRWSWADIALETR